ncbi:MAG: DUF4058 family protein [Isosphaeraceae bacterium]
MPIHDWTRVDAGLFHAFHYHWIGHLSEALNAGVLPRDYFALPEQSIQGPTPDILTLQLSTEDDEPGGGGAGRAVATAPPRTRVVCHADERVYARKANQIAVRHRHGRIVAVVELVSPGNKASTSAFRTFVEKSSDLIMQDVHLLVIDLFPPTKRDPQGIHKAIWDQIKEEEFKLPAGKPLTLASYDAGPPPVAYVEPTAVGDVLPEMPIFLKPGFYVPAPLEATYQETWSRFPQPMKRLLEPPAGSLSADA